MNILTKKILLDELHEHFQNESVECIHFAFRWMLCLFTRELDTSLICRLWDTYFAEGRGFSLFHSYLCAAFVLQWSSKLKKSDFNTCILFLQRFPANDWTVQHIEELINRAWNLGKYEKSCVDSCASTLSAFVCLLLSKTEEVNLE